MDRRRGGGRGQRGRKHEKEQSQSSRDQPQQPRRGDHRQPPVPREQGPSGLPRDQGPSSERPSEQEKPQGAWQRRPRRDEGEERRPALERPPAETSPRTEATPAPPYPRREPPQQRRGRGRSAAPRGRSEQLPTRPPPGFTTHEPPTLRRPQELVEPGIGRGAAPPSKLLAPPAGETIEVLPLAPPSKPPAQPVGKTSEAPPGKSGETKGDAAALKKVLEEKLVLKERPLAIDLARRPDKGKEGRKLAVFANHFKIQIPGGNVYHYDVTITPKRRAVQEEKGEPKERKFRPLSLTLNRKLFEEFRATCSEFRNCYPVFDGNKNLFTRRPLGIKSETKFTLDHREEEMDKDGNPKISQFEVVIKPVVKKDKSCAINLDSLHGVINQMTSEVDLEAVMAIEVILRYCPSQVFVPVGRSLYKPPAPTAVFPLSNGLQLWFGYHQSVHVGEKGIFFNLDRAVTAFYPSIPLLELVLEILELDPAIKTLTSSQTDRLKKELRMLKIKTTHSLQRKYTIKNISKKSSKQATFKMDNRIVSVADYFNQKYNVRLKYPLFPCVDVGTREKEVLLPMEVCHVIENQPHRSKLTSAQTSEIIKITAVEPNKRFAEITKKLDEVDRICNPVKREFDIKIDKNPHKLIARQLPSPFIVYYGEQKIRVNDGSWDLRNSQLYNANYKLEHWVIISLASDRFCHLRILETFSNKLIQQAEKLGITMDHCREIYFHKSPDPATDISNLLKTFKNNIPELQLAVLVLRGNISPDKDRQLYSIIKKTGDKDLSLPTQCVKDTNVVKKCTPQLLANILLKINAKLGGVNSSFAEEQKLPILKESAIIIGADVSHPAPGDRVKPSIAAVVGSLDNHPSRYFASVRLQKRQRKLESRLEIIQELRDMIKEVLKEYFKSTRVKPKKIIFFRDGVSEGQFQDVLDEEVRQIKEACQDLSSGTVVYDPALTFVVIQKRHHTRFVPENPKDAIRSGNVPPGLTVDTDIVHPVNFDYYQCSHAGIKGTSRPTKYTVLRDENNFTADGIQKLTHYLCHIFMRCTRSISLPSPVQYAHLAAFRAKNHLESLNIDTSSVSSEGLDEEAEISQELINAVTLNPQFRNSMYFC